MTNAMTNEEFELLEAAGLRLTAVRHHSPEWVEAQFDNPADLLKLYFAFRELPGWPDLDAIRSCVCVLEIAAGVAHDKYVDGSDRRVDYTHAANVAVADLCGEIRDNEARSAAWATACKIIREILKPPPEKPEALVDGDMEEPGAAPWKAAPPASAERAPWPWPVPLDALYNALSRLKKDLGDKPCFFRKDYGKHHERNLNGHYDHSTSVRDLPFYFWNWDVSNDLDGTALPAWKETTDRLLVSGIMRWTAGDGALAVSGERLDAFLLMLKQEKQGRHAPPAVGDADQKFAIQVPAGTVVRALIQQEKEEERPWPWAVPHGCFHEGLNTLRAQHDVFEDMINRSRTERDIARWLYWHDCAPTSIEHQRGWEVAVRQLFACGVLSWVCCPVSERAPRGNRLVVDVGKLDEVLAGGGPDKVQPQWSMDGRSWADGNNEHAAFRRTLVTKYDADGRTTLRVRAT